MKTADIVGGLIGMLIGVLIFWQSALMPTDVVMKIGPGFFPSLMAGGLFLFSAVLLVNALRGKSQGEVQPLKVSDKGAQRGIVLLAAGVAFVLVLEPLGFVLTAITFLTGKMLVMGLRKPAVILCVPALITASVWVVFEKLLHLSLPAGILSSIL
ncbi:MAG: tripartite tricarboxylate transporter TctB family protein [Rhodoferax sp.]|nr:tripartite tricarboxylate transporter TctB family protein [Rhodoferax sp.]